MAGCTQGNSRLSVIIIVTSGRPCNQGEPWKEHWHLWLSWEKGYVGTGVCWGSGLIRTSKGPGVCTILSAWWQIAIWQMVATS